MIWNVPLRICATTSPGVWVPAANVAAGNAGSPLGLSAYKLLDPAILGDIAGDASIDATAVSDLAASTSVAGQPEFIDS